MIRKTTINGQLGDAMVENCIKATFDRLSSHVLSILTVEDHVIAMASCESTKKNDYSMRVLVVADDYRYPTLFDGPGSTSIPRAAVDLLMDQLEINILTHVTLRGYDIAGLNIDMKSCVARDGSRFYCRRWPAHTNSDSLLSAAARNEGDSGDS